MNKLQKLSKQHRGLAKAISEHADVSIVTVRNGIRGKTVNIHTKFEIFRGLLELGLIDVSTDTAIGLFEEK